MASSSLTGYSPNNPRRYLGPNVAITTIVTRNREPTGADIKQPNTGKYYPFGTLWLIGENPTTGSVGDLWYLSQIQANVAYWIQFDSGDTELETLTGDSGGAIPSDANHNIDIKSDANFTALDGTGIITGAGNQLTLDLTRALASPQPIGTTVPSSGSFTGLGLGVIPPVSGIELANTNGITYDTPAAGAGTTPTSNTQLIYEEGEFTPVMFGETTPGTTIYTDQVGRYVRIGNWVWIQYFVGISSATGTGNANFLMPFVCENTTIIPQSLGSKQAVATNELNLMQSIINPNTLIAHLRAEGATTVYQVENVATFYNGSLFYRTV